MLRFYRRFAATAPDELTVSAGLMHAPDGRPVVVVVPVYSGDDLDEGERLLRPLRDFGAPVADSIAPVSCAEVSSAMDDLAPAGRRYSWRSAFVTDLDDGTIDALATGFDRVPSTSTLVLIDHMHGAVTRIAPTATAFPHRGVGFNLILSAGWDDPGDDKRNIGWADEVWTPIGPRPPACTSARWAPMAIGTSARPTARTTTV